MLAVTRSWLPLERERLRQRGRDAARRRRVVVAVDVLDQDRELVAAQPGDRVRLAGAGEEPLGRGDRAAGRRRRGRGCR